MGVGGGVCPDPVGQVQHHPDDQVGEGGDHEPVHQAGAPEDAVGHQLGGHHKVEGGEDPQDGDAGGHGGGGGVKVPDLAAPLLVGGDHRDLVHPAEDVQLGEGDAVGVLAGQAVAAGHRVKGPNPAGPTASGP